MRIPRPLDINSRLTLVVSFAAVMLVSACSVNVRKDAAGQDKKVDIETLVGGIHVSKNADFRDTGLPVYPGARPKRKNEENGEGKSANVNISGMGFGVRVVAVEFESDDPPQKLIAFYQGQLKKYGNVLECHSHKGADVNTIGSGHGSRELKCSGDDDGKTVELKVGTEENQHIVSIEPQGKGSNFALVYVQAHGKDSTI